MNRAFRLQSHIYCKKSPPRVYLLFEIEINELRNDKNVVNYDFAEVGTFYSALKKYTRLFSRNKCVQS